MLEELAHFGGLVHVGVVSEIHGEDVGNKLLLVSQVEEPWCGSSR